jgi:predicted acylesterase/phospholipase RssA/CRP-like cAMP-binding protein
MDRISDASAIDRQADLKAIIRDVPIFGELSEAERAAVAESCTFRAIGGGVLLCRQGSPGTELYIVITGRLRAVRADGAAAPRVLGEIGRGELIGEMALMTDGARTADVFAIRDSIVAQLNKAAFDQLITRLPQLVKQIARVMLERLALVRRTSASRTGAETLCLVPAGGGKPDLAALGTQLATALTRFGPVTLISSSMVPEQYRFEPESDMQRTAAWLNSLESLHRFILYITDDSDTAWTRLCLRQADLILLTGAADGDPTESPVETLIRGLPESRAVRQLVLIHPPATTLPRGTRQWLDARPGVDHHFHLRAMRPGDVDRLARILARCPQGLVLGGGGARGFAHVGVYQALSETGFAVDLVGGTSIGAAFGALMAMDLTPPAIVEACRVFKEEKVDYTLPMLALSGGFGLAAAARKLFGDILIEDLWLPFFCVTTNLTRAELTIHRTGPLAKWVRASCSLPGALPPVFDGAELHADGCLLNNLPVDVMRPGCGGPIVAVDIDQSADISTDLPYHEGISGWRVLLQRVSPFGLRPRVPHVGRLFHRALMVASAQNSGPSRALADLYLSPPVQDCNVFDWKKGPRVLAEAHAYAAERLAQWPVTVGMAADR